MRKGAARERRVCGWPITESICRMEVLPSAGRQHCFVHLMEITSRVLQARSPASHNKILGQRIPHPVSTKFDEDFESPIAKRLKRYDSTDSSLSRNVSDEEEEMQEHSPSKQHRREVPDSEAECDEEIEFAPTAARKTDIENSFLPIKTNKEAIADYEASRAADPDGVTVLHGRLGQRKWVPGKSSIYVDAFNLALDTVLEDEGHLFDEAESTVFGMWRNLSYEAQYL